MIRVLGQNLTMDIGLFKKTHSIPTTHKTVDSSASVGKRAVQVHKGVPRSIYIVHNHKSCIEKNSRNFCRCCSISKEVRTRSRAFLLIASNSVPESLLTSHSFFASRTGLLLGTMNPVTLSTTFSANPSASLTTQIIPAACASSTALQNPS